MLLGKPCKRGGGFPFVRVSVEAVHPSRTQVEVGYVYVDEAKEAACVYGQLSCEEWVKMVQLLW
jgi:hypothetical protein